MQVSVEKTGDLERRMTVQIPADNIDAKVSGRLNELRGQVRLKGFRPGKVPMNVIRQRYGQQVREEVLGQLMQSSLEEAIGEQDFRVASVNRVEPASGADGKSTQFEFVADMEVFPEVPELDVQGLEIERPQAEIDNEDVDDMIETLREQRRQWHTAERPAEEGDRVRIAYVADLEGVRVPDVGQHEIAPTLGAMTSFPTLEAALKGVSAGDKKSIELSFPEDYRHAALAGKNVPVELEVKLVEHSHLPEIDDEFAKAFGVDGGIDQLRSDVRRNLERELRQALANRIKRAVTDGLLARHGDVQLPPSAITQEARQMQAQVQQQQGGQQGSPPALDMFRESAEKRLRLGLLMGEFARQNDVKIDAALVDAKLKELSETYEEPAQIVELYRSDERLMDQVENLVLEEQVLELILERAKVSEKSMTFKQLMEQA